MHGALPGCLGWGQERPRDAGRTALLIKVWLESATISLSDLSFDRRGLWMNKWRKRETLGVLPRTAPSRRSELLKEAARNGKDLFQASCASLQGYGAYKVSSHLVYPCNEDGEERSLQSPPCLQIGSLYFLNVTKQSCVAKTRGILILTHNNGSQLYQVLKFMKNLCLRYLGVSNCLITRVPWGFFWKYRFLSPHSLRMASWWMNLVWRRVLFG